MKRHATGSVRFFSMVEVALATAVVGFGFASIMALFPIGISSSRDAMAESYSAEIGDQFIHFVESRARLMTAPTTSNWSALIENNSDTLIPLPQGRPEAPGRLTAPDSLSGAIDNEGTIYSLGAGKYRVIRYTDTDGDNKYTAGKDYIDFDAILLVWKSQVVISGQALEYKDAATVNVEIRWTSPRDDSDRTSSFYCKDLFNR